MTPHKKQDTADRKKTPKCAEEKQEHQEDGQQGQGEGDGRDWVRKFCPGIVNRRSFLEMLRILRIDHKLRTGRHIHSSQFHL